MTRYVIGPDVALRLALERVDVAGEHELLAPTLMRSHLLARLFAAVQHGEMTRREADAHLETVRKLKVRLLGDRVLQRVAWSTAEELGWTDTFDAEYVALTKLQGDAFVTLDERLAAAVAGVVPVAPFSALLDP